MSPQSGARSDADAYRKIAEAIAAGANQLLPEGFKVREERADICVEIRGELVGTFGVGSVLEDRPSDVGPEDVAAVAANLLNWLQDVVSEDHTWPWPSVSDRPPGYMAAYRADVRDGVLRMWYEAEGKPVTSVAEVPLLT